MIAGLGVLATFAVAFATAASYARDWRLALIAHFRLHLAAAGLFSLLLVAVGDLPGGARLALLVVAVATALVNLREIVRATPRGTSVDGGRRLRLAFANVLRTNPDAGRLIDWVRREKVNVLVVAEAVLTFKNVRFPGPGTYAVQVRIPDDALASMLLERPWPMPFRTIARCLRGIASMFASTSGRRGLRKVA